MTTIRSSNGTAAVVTAPSVAPVTLDDVRRVHRAAAEQIARRPAGDEAIVEIVDGLIDALRPLGVALPAGTLAPDSPAVVALRSLAWAHRRLDRVASATHDAVLSAHVRSRDLLPRI